MWVIHFFQHIWTVFWFKLNFEKGSQFLSKMNIYLIYVKIVQLICVFGNIMCGFNSKIGKGFPKS